MSMQHMNTPAHQHLHPSPLLNALPPAGSPADPVISAVPKQQSGTTIYVQLDPPAVSGAAWDVQLQQLPDGICIQRLAAQQALLRCVVTPCSGIHRAD